MFLIIFVYYLPSHFIAEYLICSEYIDCMLIQLSGVAYIRVYCYYYYHVPNDCVQ